MNAIISQFRTAIMGITMLFVIMFHQGFISGAIPTFFHTTGYLGVDAFLFISGFGIYFSLYKSKTINKAGVIDFYTRRILRMMPTCIIAGITLLYLWSASIPSLYHPWSPNFCSAFIGLDVWYIRTIMIYYLIAPFLYYFIKTSKYTLLILIVLSIATPFIDKACSWMVWKFCGGSFFLQQTLGWTIARLPAFVFGMLFAHLNPDKNKFTNWKYVVFAIMCTSLLFTSPYIYKLAEQSYPVYKFLNIFTSHKVMILPGLPILFLIAFFILQKIGKHIKNVLEWIGNHSLELFLTHSAIFPYAKTTFGSGCLVFAGALAASILTAVCLKYTANRISSILRARDVTTRHSRSSQN